MNWLSRKIVSSLLWKTCPATIPRSGDEAKKINCYSLSLYEGENPKLLITKLTEQGFLGKYWDGNSFLNEVIVPFHYAIGLSLRIEHYHGQVTHSYRSLISFLLHEWTWIYKIQSIYIIAKHHVPQFFFNRKNLQLPHRMKLLEKIIEKQASEPHKPIDSMGLMTYIYSTRWYLHPNRTVLRQKMDLYLESFAKSGELENKNPGGAHLSRAAKYQITGQAIATLEKYQIETARAKDAEAHQRSMRILTAVLAFFAAFQSGLFKSSPLFNFDELLNWIKSLI